MTPSRAPATSDEVLTCVGSEREIIQQQIRGIAPPDRSVEILEAGCGRQWPMKVEGVTQRLTGVDLDKEALDHRINVSRDLHEAIYGDIRSVELPAEKFDVVYSAYVLEHIPGVAQALANFVRWLRPGGLLILRIPDRDSAFAFVSRTTPMWFHVAYYRYVLGRPQAGKPGFAPYPVAYDKEMSRTALHAFCEQHHLTPVVERRVNTLPAISRAVSETISLLSFRRLAGGHNNLLMVFRKAAAPAPA